jgi:Tol biopolymer transport system component
VKTIDTSGRTLSERTRPATTALVLALVTAVLLVLVQEPAGATFPGKNGKIAFSDGYGVSAMNENGSGKQVLTNMYPFEFTYSPDGSKIAYVANEGVHGYDLIYVMNGDGSGLKRLTTNEFRDEGSPAFSPDGSKIAFNYETGGVDSIYVINADGSGLKRLVDTPGDDNRSPVFSPEGERIAFIHQPDPYTIETGECEKNSVRVVNVDGTGLRDLTGCTQNPVSYDPPAWSPSGTKIAFQETEGPDSIYDIKVDGPASPRNLTPDSLFASEPSYSPDGSKILYEATTGPTTSTVSPRAEP